MRRRPFCALGMPLDERGKNPRLQACRESSSVFMSNGLCSSTRIPSRFEDILQTSGARDSRIIVRFPELQVLLSMVTFLDEIVAATRRRVAGAKSGADLRDLKRRAEQHVPRGFRRALAAKGRDGITVIAELKKASPSKGLIRAEFRPAELAGELEAAGAAALSVLTDEEFFQGSLRNLREASAAVSIPCLRKDFIVDEFQLLEARANCADAVLLIVAALGSVDLVGLTSAASSQGLDVLCEVHDGAELERALDAGCDLIGVNTRDLRTFKVDLQTAFDLAEKFPRNVVRVAESGIHSGDDMARLRAAGYDAFLVGESLMRAERPGEALRELMRVPSREYRLPSGR
jgi:indole-3-glycerol phosphate synthase